MENERKIVNGLLSVIIPVYNIEPYLRKCIESVLNQTYTNMEVILIDDGSTDGSGAICDEYQSKDRRVKVFHKENGGQSTARNWGLRIATGEFLGFVDADDYIETDMYESLLREMDEDVDIVTCGTFIDFPENQHSQNKLAYYISKRQKFDNISAIEELLRYNIFCYSVCDKIFRKKLFDNIRFPEGRTCEDLPVAYALFAKSRNVVHLGQPKYHYFQRDNSTSRQDFYYRRIDFVLFAGEICKDIRRRYPKLVKLAEAVYLQNAAYIIRCINCSRRSNEYQYLIDRLVKMFFHMSLRILSNNNISFEIKWEYLADIIIGRGKSYGMQRKY